MALAVKRFVGSSPIASTRNPSSENFWSGFFRFDAGDSADAGAEDRQMASGASLGSSSAWCRITLCVSNVENRGLAPMSSATISTLDRQVWSSVAQLRWSRRPVTSGLITIPFS